MVAASPPFDVLPGAAASPVLLHVPHSARELPRTVRAGIVLDDEGLEQELDHITDAHTGEIAARAAHLAQITPWRFVNRLSRLVVDPERFPDEREEMLAVGMGAVYTRTTHGAPLRPAEFDPDPLIEQFFRPYAHAMTDLVAARLAATGRAIIIDLHSYPTKALPYELHGAGPRPPVCLGTDALHTPQGLLHAARQAFTALGDIGLDSPFAGAYVPLQFYGRDARVSGLMVEIRRDTYMTEPGGPADGGLGGVPQALAALLDTITHPPPA